uniref:Myosin motor domain-containing protein n=1 Tax=Elaeophora elaphi TaxID=1147741 RepID=A0A0R3RHL6_9BILA
MAEENAEVCKFEDDPGYPYLEVSREEKSRNAAKPFDSKKNCWIPDADDGFVAAEIKSSAGDNVTVVTVKGNEVTVKKEEVQEMNPPKFSKTEDMANLTFLNEASVLNNLKERYYSMMIYTYSGLFCVVINPYKRLPIYSPSIIKYYMGKRRNEVPPHLFAVSDEAYRNILIDHENQSMLITGESGAGKTENTKKVITYFAIVGATQQKKEEGKKGGTLEEQIVQTNPVLEAFGNAKTVRNNNSSRFGKFIRTHFTKDGKLAGGDIEHYLFEKSRVVRQAPGERSYHIYYQLMSGYHPKIREDLHLTNDLTYYHFCSQAELTIDGVDDKEEMKITQEAFDIMGFEDHETHDLYSNVAGIMHMGEMKFKQRPREEQAEPDGEEDAKNASFCFGVDHEEFLKALTKPRVRVGAEWVNKGQNLEQVHWAVDGLGKAIYSRMFKWIIDRCNKTLDQNKENRKYFIGVLDIAGFEIFDFNSFEQLWINFVNERLQQFFNHHMFVLEQEEYKREGIAWTFIDFGLDLQACIELIEKPLGIISMLDEECIVPKATDMTLVQKLNDQHLGKHPNYQKPRPPKGKQAEAHFAIVHYAGTVRYNVTNFLEKNKDPLNDSAVAILKHCHGNQLLLEIWADYQTQEEAAEAAKAGVEGGRKKGKSASFMTVSMMYRESLNNLMGMLYQTHPHFIRCIIPNEKKASGVIDSALVLNQLTCNGVLEGIRICRKGYPNRMVYPDFKHRYAILAADAARSSDEKAASTGITDFLCNNGKLSDEEFKMGETKIFFKAGILARLEDLRDEALRVIMTNLQAQVRTFLGLTDRKRRLHQKSGLLMIQRNIRTWCLLRTWDWFKLYGRVKPMLKAGKEAEEMEKLNDKIKTLEDTLLKEEGNRKELESQIADLTSEKDKLFENLEKEKVHSAEAEERVQKLNAMKAEMERQLQDLSDRVAEMDDRNENLNRAKKKTEQEVSDLKRKNQELEMALRKAESEKQSREQNIRSLQGEMASQDEAVARVNKEKKQQEEINRKLMEDLQAEEDKVNHMQRVKTKLEQQLDDLEEKLEREKRTRLDLEKAKRKVEGELKVAQENMGEITTQKHDVEQILKRKDADLIATMSKLDGEQSMVNKLQKQIKELEGRISELEEDLEQERQSRGKLDRAKSDLQRELDEISQRLDEQGGATAAQIELNKKREAEMAKLKRDLEENNMNHDLQISALRKKHNDAVAELSDQLEQMQKLKAKLDKDKGQMLRDLEEANSNADAESRQKQEFEKHAKLLEMQLSELQTKADEQTRLINDFTALKNRLSNENSDLSRQLEDLENQINGLHRLKAQLISQLEEAKRIAEEESRERQNLTAQVKNLEHQNDNLRIHADEESEGKAECLRQMSKLNAEIQQWKARFEGEGLAKMEEIEEAKRKLMEKVQDLTDVNEAANAKIMSLEKTRHKLMGDLDDAQVDVERAAAYAGALEKKQRAFDRIVEEWRKKCDDLSAELESAQRDNRNLSTELFKAKSVQDELLEQIESLRRENKSLSLEIKDLTDQLTEGGRSVHELQKMIRRLEAEKEELQKALDDAESALEAEEAKVLRAQVEVSQVRAEIEKRIQEKEEEFENTRKNHQRALESMQATLEAEIKAKQEALRIKKKLEQDINELEVALDHANKANADAQKTIKRYQEQIRELQMQVEDEQRQKDDLAEQLANTQKRAAILQAEKDELANQAEMAERARRSAEQDAIELRETVNDLTNQVNAINNTRRKLEAELQSVHVELDETTSQLKNTDELLKQATADAARLAEELRQEQEHSVHVERMRRALEVQIKEMQVRLDEAEQAALRSGQKIIAKLEMRIRELEQELDGEQRRSSDYEKELKKGDRRIKELQFQCEEDRKNNDRLTELVDKLQIKIKIYKRQVEEAEEVAAVNLGKYRQLQTQLDDANERADIAENSLAKLRSKNRASTIAPLALSASASFIRVPSQSDLAE